MANFNIKDYVSFNCLDCKFVLIMLALIALEIIDLLPEYLGSEFLNKIYDSFYDYRIMNLFLSYLAHILFIIPDYFLNKKLKEETNENNSSKKTVSISYLTFKYICKEPEEGNGNLTSQDISLTILACIIDLFVECFYIFVDDYLCEKEEEESYNDVFYFFQIIILSFYAKYFLNQKFYKYHYFSEALLILFEIIRNIFIIIDGNFSFSRLLVELFYILGKSYVYVYFKFLMENKYISVYNCCYLLGIINAPILFIIYLIISFIPCSSEIFCSIGYIDNFIEFFKNIDFPTFVAYILNAITFALYTFVINLTIKNYPIFHLIILFQITEIMSSLFSSPLDSVFFIIEIIFICIFAEIIILKFCNLNGNNKEDINKRALSDDKGEDIYDRLNSDEKNKNKESEEV